MSLRGSVFLRRAFVVMLVALTGCAHGREAARDWGTYDHRMLQPLDPEGLDQSLLEETLILFTNRSRVRQGLAGCVPERRLQEVARAHSEEMARLDYFSHVSPVPENRLLLDRVRQVGMRTDSGSVIFGENIGVDALLAIAEVPLHDDSFAVRAHQLGTEGHPPVAYQTYWRFARKMVGAWMRSPGHRKNILDRGFSRVGIGVATGVFRGFPAIFVTQNFYGAFSS